MFSLSDRVAVAALVAWLYDASGGFEVLFLVMAGCSALMGVAALFLLPATRPAHAAMPAAAE